MHEVLAESLGERSSLLIPISQMCTLGWRRIFDQSKCYPARFFPCKPHNPHPRRPSSSVHSKCVVCRSTPFFLRFDLYAFFFRIKFAVLSVVKNDPLNARRCDNHGLKLRRKQLQCSVCQFSPVVQHKMPESAAEQVLSRLYSLWTAQFSGTQDVLKCVVF